jgi:site-specific DNA-cytosine methylase
LQGKNNRRLSWKECRILQCLPDTLNPDIDLIHKYMVVGNAVPPVFAKALLRPVVEYEKKLGGF